MQADENGPHEQERRLLEMQDPASLSFSKKKEISQIKIYAGEMQNVGPKAVCNT